jgi:hypothetical protein
MNALYKAMLSISCCLALLFLFRHPSNWSTQHLKIVCHYDQLFSIETEEIIKKHLSTASSKTPIHALLTELQKKAPHAQALSRRFFADGTINYGIKAEKPLVLINNNLVFTSQETLRPISFFKEESLATLASCTVLDPLALEKDEKKAFKTFVSSHLESLNAQYRIVWHNKTDILLQPKETERGNLIITSWQPIDDLFIKKSRSAEQLLLEYKEKGLPRKADLRYQDFIIISA